MVEYLFDDNFSVSRLDPDGKKFDRGNVSLAFPQ
jgi:DNA-directed RNA polymerase I, II, and III subunit RPABC3